MSTRRILVTGGDGMFAYEMQKYITEFTSDNIVLCSKVELDICAKDNIENIFLQYRPDILINTAVYHVDPCETCPEMGFRINSYGPKQLAEVCNLYKCKIVQLSSCGLFGDEIKSYNEYDNIVNKTIYAKSKYYGEIMVKENANNFLILRLGWLYGGSANHKRNFVTGRLRESLNSKKILSADDKYGSPTYAGDACRAIYNLIEHQATGLFHIANSGIASRADYVEKIMKSAKNKVEVVRVKSDLFPRKANVPDCEALECLNLKFSGFKCLPSWDESLEKYTKEICSQ